MRCEGFNREALEVTEQLDLCKIMSHRLWPSHLTDLMQKTLMSHT